MDKIDKMLITLLQKNARMPLKALAENVFYLHLLCLQELKGLKEMRLLKDMRLRLTS